MESIKALRQICQASEKERAKHLFSVQFFRLFSIYLTRILLPTRLTPNQVSALGTFLCVAAPFLFILNDLRWNIVAIVLYLAGYVLDYCDGEMARYRKTAGKAGGWYVEPVSHDIQYAFFFIPLGLAAYQINPSPWMLVLGFSASWAKLLLRALETRFQLLVLLEKEYRSQKHENPLKHAAPTHMRWDAKLYEILFAAPAFLPVLIIAGLTFRYDVFLWFYGITLPLIFLVYLGIAYTKLQPYLRP